jgi:hypothetical protein
MARRTVRLVTVLAASIVFAGPVGIASTSAGTGDATHAKTDRSMTHQCHSGKAHPYSMYSTKTTKNGLDAGPVSSH